MSMARKTDSVLLGFEVGTGERVEIPVGHMVVTGQTQAAGKTTSLEALIHRSGLKAIAFITKRGEGAFAGGKTIPPYFRERADWVFVSGLIDATLSEKNKILRAWLMKVCRGTKTLAEVQANVKKAQKTARGFSESIYTEIDGYLDLVVPEIENLPPAREIRLENGLNVMDLSAYSTALQSLVIRSVVEYVYEHENAVITVIPEAWEFLPELRGSPCKPAIETLIRKGGGLGNFIWADSLPSYESFLCRVDGVVTTRSFESLFSEGGKTATGANGEDIRIFNRTVEVLSQNGDRLAWKKSRGILRHPWKGSLVSINTTSGVVDVSDNHPVLKKCQRSFQYRSAGSLKVGDFLSTRAFVMDQGSRRLFGESRLFVGTLDLAWLYGFFAAEGWVTGNVLGMCNKDVTLIRRAIKIIAETFHFSACINTPVKGVYSLNVRSPQLCAHFRRVCYLPGLFFTSRTKVVPDAIMNSDKDLQEAWLSGYFTGDGTKRRGRVDGFTTVSRSLAIGVLYLKRDRTSTVQIRADKPDVVQVSFSTTTRSSRGLIKKIARKQYEGYLYDLVDVDSPDHGYYAGVGNIRVSNSQDLAGVWKLAVRAAKVYLIGVQREANEIKRTLNNIPDSVAKPSAKGVATLELGQFYACWGKHVIRTYVQPSWLSEEDARQVALGNTIVSEEWEKAVEELQFIKPENITWSSGSSRVDNEIEQQGDEMDEKFVREMFDRQTTILDRLTDQVLFLAERQASISVGEVSRNGDIVPGIKLADSNGGFHSNIPVNVDGLYKEFRERILKDKAVLMKLSQVFPEIEIETTRPVVQMSDSNLQGWLVTLISKGFFDKGATGSAAYTELVRLGKRVAKPGVYGALDKLTEMGAVTKENDGANKLYVKNPDLKITRREK